MTPFDVSTVRRLERLEGDLRFFMEDRREDSHEGSSRFSDKSGDNRFTE